MFAKFRINRQERKKAKMMAELRDLQESLCACRASIAEVEARMVAPGCSDATLMSSHRYLCELNRKLEWCEKRHSKLEARLNQDHQLEQDFLQMARTAQVQIRHRHEWQAHQSANQ